MKTEKHESLTKEMHDTYKSKNADYGDSFGKSVKAYGAIAGFVRISDKFHRAESLILKGNPKVKDESLRDTLLDMANYCVMLVMEIEP